MEFEFYHFKKWEGYIPERAVYASDNYVVIRADHDGEHVPGKLHTTEMKAYIPYGGKEITVSNFEVLVHQPGAKINWVGSADGFLGAKYEGCHVGPWGKDQYYVCRAVCPAPENAWTPGKIHPAHGCAYISWGGKEHKCTAYETLVITHHHHHH